MVKIPELKKKIHSFLTKEEGKISKEKLIKTGVLLSAAALVSVDETEALTTLHDNVLTLAYSDPTATVTHAHTPAQ